MIKICHRQKKVELKQDLQNDDVERENFHVKRHILVIQINKNDKKN